MRRFVLVFLTSLILCISCTESLVVSERLARNANNPTDADPDQGDPNHKPPEMPDDEIVKRSMGPKNRVSRSDNTSEDPDSGDPFHESHMLYNDEILRRSIDDEDDSYILKKRQIVQSQFLWKDKTVPYSIRHDGAFPWSHGDSGENLVRRTLEYIQDWSCLKFPLWTSTLQQELGISHNNFLRFESKYGPQFSSPCHAVVGMTNNPGTGQTVSIGPGCKSVAVVVHEVGHALGMHHTRNRPDRDAVLKVKWEEMAAGSFGGLDLYRNVQLLTPYDLESSMGGLGSKITRLYDEAYASQWKYSYLSFYDQMTLAKAYECDKGANCPSACQNFGFVGTFSGVCKCRCPEGVGGSSCEREHRGLVNSGPWPAGQFGLIKSSDGCPDASMETGELTETTDQVNPHNQWTTGHHFAGDLLTNKLKLEFCMAPSGGSGSTEFWPKGSYCVYQQGNSCPEGFTSGWVQMDDENLAELNENGVSGSVPKMDYMNDVKFYFCCRDDGNPETSISLPNQNPFYLLLNQDFFEECQNVEGMYHSKEYIVWDAQDRESEKILAKSLPHPWTSGSSNYKIWFCYYRPLTYCGGVIHLNNDGTSQQIQSPQYPTDYSSDHECNWVVKSSDGYQITMDFNDLDIEKSGENCVDYLEVKWHELGNVGRRYCGSTVPSQVRSIHNVMIITFRSGEKGTNKGFQATLKAVQATPCVEPPQPANTNTLVSNLIPGTFIAYECVANFIKSSGDFARQCLPDGSWTQSPPVCVQGTCPQPTGGTNTALSNQASSYNAGEKAEFQCSCSGCDFVSGSYSLKCKNNPISTAWDGTPPTCEDVSPCYTPVDSGVSYRGSMSHTHDYKPCKKWAETSKTSEKYPNAGLENNYCRNPDKKARPWCYKEEGWWDYCNVCGNNCHDKHDDCATRVSADSSYCTTDDAFQNCHKTCEKCSVGVTNAVSCNAPESGTGVTMSSSATSFTVGQSVTYSCIPANGIVISGDATRTCLSDGTWTGTAPVCEDYSCIKTYENKFISAGESLYSGGVADANGCKFKLVTIKGALGATYNSDSKYCWVYNRDPKDGTGSGSSWTAFGTDSCCLDKHTDCASRVSSNSNYCTENDALLNCWDTCGKCVDGNPNKVPCVKPSDEATATVQGNTFLYTEGQTLIYSCTANGGVVVSGDGTRTCQLDGTWSGTPPVCEVPCSAPAAGTAATFQPVTSSYTSGQTVTYTCNDANGLLIAGDKSRTCQADGTWTGDTAVCEDYSCIKTYENKFISAGESLYSGSVADAKACKLKLVTTKGGLGATYNSDWKYCWVYNRDPKDGTGSGASWTAFGTDSCCLDKHTDCTAKVSSNSNYCTENDALLNCWDTCGKCVDGNPNKVPCVKPSDEATATVQGNTFLYSEGQTLTYSCTANGGVVVSGDGTRTCQSDGTWSGTPPVCEVPCSPPEAGTAASFQPILSSYNSGTVVTYTCDNQEQWLMMSGSKTRTCQADGAWTGSAPVCQDYSCIKIYENQFIGAGESLYSGRVADANACKLKLVTTEGALGATYHSEWKYCWVYNRDPKDGTGSGASWTAFGKDSC